MGSQKRGHDWATEHSLSDMSTHLFQARGLPTHWSPTSALIKRIIRCRLKYCYGSFGYAICYACFLLSVHQLRSQDSMNWFEQILSLLYRILMTGLDLLLLVFPLLLSCLGPLDSLLGFVAHPPFVTLEQNSCQDWHSRCKLFHRSTSHLWIVISTIYHLF